MIHLKPIFLLATVSLTGCATLAGFTGADEGQKVGDWIVYNAFHPGLDIKIMEPYDSNLIPISTIKSRENQSMKHTITYGTKQKKQKLELIGKYKKEIYFNEKYYGSLWFGSILIKDDLVFIDN